MITVLSEVRERRSSSLDVLSEDGTMPRRAAILIIIKEGKCEPVY